MLLLPRRLHVPRVHRPAGRRRRIAAVRVVHLGAHNLHVVVRLRGRRLARVRRFARLTLSASWRADFRRRAPLVFPARRRRHPVLVRLTARGVVSDRLVQEFLRRDALSLHDTHRVAPRPPVNDVLRTRNLARALLVEQERNDVIAVGVHVHAAEDLEVRRERDVDLAERQQRLFDELRQIRAEDSVLVAGGHIHMHCVYVHGENVGISSHAKNLQITRTLQPTRSVNHIRQNPNKPASLSNVLYYFASYEL